MNFALVKQIADAVLYEGYLLYPYRHSSVKNRQRFNFGVLAPQAYSEAQRGTESWHMQTECLVLGDERTTLNIQTRFLHLLLRESVNASNGDEQSWQEAVEREVDAPSVTLGALLPQPQRLAFTFPAEQQTEPLREADGQVVGTIIRRQQTVSGALELAAAQWGERLFKLTVRVLNTTPFEQAGERSRDEALLSSLASAHTILGVTEGEFVSLLDRPDEYKTAVAACQNLGTWPVLVGAEGERDLMLSSPIILYDYPQIAPESAGDLFDGAEIDEILTLRILTLTEDEKREMRDADDRTRQILERTETLPAEQLMKLHGALRGLRQ